MIANDRFDTITVKESGRRWTVHDANDVILYEYTTEAAANHKATQVREWGQRGRHLTKRNRALIQMDDERVRLMSLLVRTSRYLTDTLERELEQSVGIPSIFFDVLNHVAAAPEARLTMSQLSREVAFTTGGMTRLVDRMVTAGLVVREASSRDRRSIRVALNGDGTEMLERAVVTHVESIDRHLIAPLNGNDRASLTAALTKVLGVGPGPSRGAHGEPVAMSATSRDLFSHSTTNGAELIRGQECASSVSGARAESHQ